MSDRNVTAPGNLVLTTLKKRWRAWLRAIHRDVGYLAVGLTVIYALSGLAINHIQDWDPNFKTYEKSYQIEPIDVDLDDAAAIALAQQRLHVAGTPRSTYRAGDEVHLEYDSKRFIVIGGEVTEQGRSSRFFFRVANWLHYNRGKKAWTYVADGYAVLLLYLAISGMFMLKGRLGLRWRGLILVGLGAGVPLGYVVWSGGPEAHNRQAASARDADDADAPDGDDRTAPGDDADDDGPPERPPVRTPVHPPAPD
ncbi:MAG: PepSY-associated TM helix domain-containing protein, partial [Myxococcales bacterium]|nr:PepSY-associated TM helix domain-containing protein [Myxococcales bacterium]